MRCLQIVSARFCGMSDTSCHRCCSPTGEYCIYLQRLGGARGDNLFGQDGFQNASMPVRSIGFGRAGGASFWRGGRISIIQLVSIPEFSRYE